MPAQIPKSGGKYTVILFGPYTQVQDTWRYLALSFSTSDSEKNKFALSHWLQKIKILSFLQIYFIIRIVTLKEIIKKWVSTPQYTLV